MPAFVKLAYSYRAVDYLDHEKLDELLRKEKEPKYWDLVDRITEKAGEILDASELYISASGNINGQVQGTKNTVAVETIGAGGKNSYIIVNSKHGQIFHYRTLVNII